MANGIGTGFTQGLKISEQASSRRATERENAATRAQRLATDARDAIDAAFKEAGEIVQKAEQRGFSRTHPAVKRALQAEFESAVTTAAAVHKQFGGTEFANAVPTPQRVASGFRSLLALEPTAEEEREQEAADIRSEARAKAEGEAAGTPPEPQTSTRVVSGDSPLNRRFSLGIPEGESARVEFTMDEEGNVKTANVESGFGGGGTTVNVGGVEGLPDWAKEARGDLIKNGRQAVFTSRDLTQLADLMANPATQTGSLQPAVTGLQGIAADMGIDLSGLASDMGINLGDLSSKEEFDRISTRLIIDGFEKFKGNLNRREVELAVDAFQNLGRSEEANIDAIASGLAAQEITRERALDATQATTQAEVSALQRNLLEEDATRFQELRDKFAKDIRQKREQATEKREPEDGTDRALPEGIPEGSSFLREDDSGDIVKQFYRAPNGDILVFERAE